MNDRFGCLFAPTSNCGKACLHQLVLKLVVGRRHQHAMTSTRSAASSGILCRRTSAM